MTALLLAFGVGVASALLPFFNVEAYLPVIGLHSDPALTVGLALVAAAGQTLGKVVWYVLGARGTESTWLQKKLDKGKRRETYERWSIRLTQQPLLSTGIMLASSFVGLPPLLVMAVVAGSVRMSMTIFLSTVLVGRLARFWLLLEGASALWHLDLFG